MRPVPAARQAAACALAKGAVRRREGARDIDQLRLPISSPAPRIGPVKASLRAAFNHVNFEDDVINSQSVVGVLFRF